MRRARLLARGILPRGILIDELPFPARPAPNPTTRPAPSAAGPGVVLQRRF